MDPSQSYFAFHIEGEFFVDTGEKRERGVALILVDRLGRLFLEFRRLGVSLAQISFNGSELTYRTAADEKLYCLNDDKIPFISDKWGVNISPGILSKRLFETQPTVEKNVEFVFLHRKRFAAGMKPSLIMVKKGGKAIVSIRVNKWRGLASLKKNALWLGDCHAN